MSLSKRLSSCLTVCGLTLALAAVIPCQVLAQTSSSVETYVDQVMPESTGQGVIPEGIIWNQPLKAGDMVLPRLTKPKPRPVTKKEAATAPADLKAPLLSAAKKETQAPKLSADQSSTQSIMLIQGMKSALQQAGLNPDLPKSELSVIDPSAPTKSGSTDQLMPPLMAAGGSGLGAPTLVAPNYVAPALQDGSQAFVTGQEPKIFSPATSDAETASIAAATASDTSGGIKESKDGFMDIIFPPEMSSEGGAPADPKITEISDQPLPLETAPVGKKESSGFFDRMSKPFASIFGEPVKEEAPALNEPVKDKAVSSLTGTCEQKVTKWTRDCSAADYPAHFVGEIVGETRIECPSGETKDVWLSNSCAAPIASSPYAVQDQKATEMQAAPAEAVSAAVPLESTAAVDGACGPSNGLASDGKPAADLCSEGEASIVLGDGPWRWNCKGRRGGMTVSCAAPVAAGAEIKKASKSAAAASPEVVVQDGKCGDAVSAGHDQAPADLLCAMGTPSRVNGSGPWTWACGGTNGGSAAACTAPKKTDGACGSANDQGTTSMPMKDLCTAGYASAVTGNGPWNWTCSGLHGGNAVTCSANNKVNAICGPSSMKGHRDAPQDGLCSSGSASSVNGSGPWSWQCDGNYGGATVSCKAPVMVDATCGAANGNQFTEAPQTGLCETGSATRVTGMGPWNWNCSGSDGGATVSCTAALGSKESVESAVTCGEASESLPLGEPKDNLCRYGKASEVIGNGPWTWNCSDDVGHSVACSTIVDSDGVCGEAVTQKSSEAPASKLCSTGTPTEVTAFEMKAWRWECKGSLSGKTVECLSPMGAGTTPAAEAQKTSAPASVPAPAPNVALCGTANTQAFADKPDSNLCEIGKASTVKGNGPWTWVCTEKKTKASCEAQKLVEGLCGKANGSVQKNAPADGLCTSGTATEVSGDGPWMWSCIGSAGGGSSSCSASALSKTKVDGLCGASANGIVTDAPSTNLCDSGVPSTVYGEGPWTWTCSGMNGGIASSCSTSKVVPKAPPPPGPAVNGVCGYSNGVASLVAPAEGLCSAGTETALSGNGPWNWSCIGGNGGMTVSCTAPLTPPAPIVGSCGTASGVPTLTTPKSGLCSAGISSAVSGKGPWTWSCSGTNGGGAVSCVAPLAGNASSARAMPSMVTPSLDSGEAPTPRSAPIGLVTPQLPTGPLPAMKPGTVPQLKMSKKGSTSEDLPSGSVGDLGSAPSVAPMLPEGLDALPPPPLRDDGKPKPGLKSPVLDSQGKPIPGARLVLEPDVSTISFSSGSDQLDKDAIEIVEKLTAIMASNGQARITLVAYAGTDGKVSPRDARRISLNRALAIRDFMTSKGVSSGRVDVRPMGANVLSGDMDRVDVKVN